MKIRPIVYENVTRNIRSLCEKVQELHLDYNTHHCHTLSQHVLNLELALLLTTETIWNEEFARNLQQIWRDSTTQLVYRKYGHLMMLTETIEYFLGDEGMERIMKCDYVPTDEDVLRIMLKTTGMIECKFRYDDNHQFCVMDTGGQRTERKKWLHSVSCFGNWN